jgi:hypothetical protein
MTGVPSLDVRDPVVAAMLLLGLELLFAARVAGQYLVVRRAPGWLPPMDQWYSGLVPYPRLLAIQVAMLIAMAAVAVGLGLRTALARPNPAVGNLVILVSTVYAASMVVRYVVRMARRPDQRWLGGTIPIVFHIVLASWLFVLGSYLRSAI